MAFAVTRVGFSVFGFFMKKFIGKKTLVTAVAALYGLHRVSQFIRMRRLRAKWNAAGKDVVVLHTIPRGKFCPCLSPFGVKLETFLRMMDIIYQIDYKVPMGPKNKLPWITVNGEDYADSELIIQKLQEMFNKFPDSNVPKEDRAIGLAMRVMMEEHFLFGVVSWRYIEDDMKGLYQVQKLPLQMKIAFYFFKRKVKEGLYQQGIGRHSPEEIHSFMKMDMEALSVYLGSKPFLLGDTPQVVDCAVFGMLTQTLYNSPGSPFLQWIMYDFPNLKSYTERMKERFWPDWNQCIDNPTLAL